MQQSETLNLNEIYVGDNRPTIESTVAHIKVFHFGQTDEIKKPYYKHPMRVANNVRRIMPEADNDTVMAALLHDVIEDCGISKKELEDHWGYSKDCTNAVVLVSDDEEQDEAIKALSDEEQYALKIETLIASGDKRAMLVKLADNCDNLHPTRVASYMSYNQKEATLWGGCYRKSVTQLCKALDLDENRVFKLIEESPALETELDLYKGMGTCEILPLKKMDFAKPLSTKTLALKVA